MTAGASSPALEIMDDELDRPSRDAAVGIGEVDSDPYAGQFLGSQGRRIARQREDRADAEQASAGSRERPLAPSAATCGRA